MSYFNAHCHLEYSFLHNRIPAGLPFVDWLRRLVEIRLETSEVEQRRAAHDAVRRLVETGTTVVLDVLARDMGEDALRQSGLRAMYFREMIDFHAETAATTLARALTRQHQWGPLPPDCAHGLSPHAPYTVNGNLLRAAASRAKMLGQWLCIHAAETPEETELLVDGTGPMRDFLFPFMPEDWQAPGIRPIAWLDDHDCLGPRTLLVHCNDINDDDIRLIRLRGAAVVVCPGTHRYFGRGAFPLKVLLDNNIPVYIGTDSLASNEDLSMEKEIAWAAELAPDIPIDRIRELTDPARAEVFFEGSKIVGEDADG